jgi:hypothetical protein
MREPMAPRSSSLSRLLFALGGIGAIAACSSSGHSPNTKQEQGAAPDPAVPNEEVTASDGGGASTSPSARDAGTKPPPPPGPPPVDIYDPEMVPRVELTFDAAAIALLSSTAEADRDTWVHGAFKMGDVTFADVGVRRKGATSFRALPAKAGFKVKFNKWVKKQKLWGLEEITLNNNISDHTYLEARLAFHVFRALGLPAARANSAEVIINGEPFGLYTNVEAPDENFLARVFGAKAKTLYEVEGGPANWMPNGDYRRWQADVPDPAAPAGTKPDAEALFQAVAAAKDATLLADLEGHLHVPRYLRYCAAEGVVGQHDGHAYGFYGTQTNFFMAGDTDGKFTLLPWSLDTAFVASSGKEIDTSIPMPEDVLLARCSRSANCWDRYKTEMRSVLTEVQGMDLVNLAKKWHAQVDPFVKVETKREFNYSFYESQTALMYDWIANRTTVIGTQLSL